MSHFAWSEELESRARKPEWDVDGRLGTALLGRMLGREPTAIV
jgi:hypothetical protein